MISFDTPLVPYRILFVIPTLGNRLDTLVKTLASIQSQRGVLVDILLVAKTASPALSTIADQYAAKVMIHPGNISGAINAGFAQANDSHRFVGWLGDDDMLRPESLSYASSVLESNPLAVVAYGSCDYINRDGDVLFTRRPPPGAPFLLQMVPGLIKQETCLFRLQALRQVGGLDEKIRYAMDLDLLLKLRRVGSFVRVDRIQAAFCWHAESLTIANRSASLAEAQDIQGRNSLGIPRLLRPVWMYPIRLLIVAMSWKINRSLN